MKILTWKQFTDLPDGVIYSEYEPVIVRGLFKRGSVIRNEAGDTIDFFCASLIGGPKCPPPYENQDHIVIEPDLYGRWGLYEYDGLWAVYEPDDLKAIAAEFTDGLAIPIEDGSDRYVPVGYRE